MNLFKRPEGLRPSRKQYNAAMGSRWMYAVLMAVLIFDAFSDVKIEPSLYFEIVGAIGLLYNGATYWQGAIDRAEAKAKT